MNCSHTCGSRRDRLQAARRPARSAAAARASGAADGHALAAPERRHQRLQLVRLVERAQQAAGVQEQHAPAAPGARVGRHLRRQRDPRLAAVHRVQDDAWRAVGR